ncbi:MULTISPECIES: EutP/PduV family microcompartment system protein [Clostridia]|jgi:ethanolamine utilization protein EutP|uniref:Ethanolamine utilization protein EutP n=1 Tax=Lacrimispora xylanolytica TaxID=29375 RepID=A0ABY7A7H2_9FIRM|nr:MULTISPECIES: EutP/PduV family microcompartment system protein [Clostridia]MBS5958214.1 ethanolamine utilization protein EutP [Clostridiales bacterium]WAJ22442.1 ethanolamine utilization protein EutP [Lacrimispora xylanolytica]
MKKLFLCGRSEAGKTSLTQALKGEPVVYHKTQYVNHWDITIDTPGEYVENKNLALQGLCCFTYESDVIGLLCSANEPFNLFPPGVSNACNRPVIGIITKIDCKDAKVPMVRQWLEEAGCEKIFPVSSITGEGMDDLLSFLKEEKEALTWEEIMEAQEKGLREWDL